MENPQLLDVVSSGGLLEDGLLPDGMTAGSEAGAGGPFAGGRMGEDDGGLGAGALEDGGWTDPSDPSEPRYCICQQVSYGDMVACDNQKVSWSKRNAKKMFLYVLEACMTKILLSDLGPSL